MEYKKLHAGFSTGLPLYARKDVVELDDGSTETQNESGTYSFHLLSGYSLGKPRKLTLDPIIPLAAMILILLVRSESTYMR